MRRWYDSSSSLWYSCKAGTSVQSSETSVGGSARLLSHVCSLKPTLAYLLLFSLSFQTICSLITVLYFSSQCAELFVFITRSPFHVSILSPCHVGFHLPLFHLFSSCFFSFHLSSFRLFLFLIIFRLCCFSALFFGESDGKQQKSATSATAFDSVGPLPRNSHVPP